MVGQGLSLYGSWRRMVPVAWSWLGMRFKSRRRTNGQWSSSRDKNSSKSGGMSIKSQDILNIDDLKGGAAIIIFVSSAMLVQEFPCFFNMWVDWLCVLWVCSEWKAWCEMECDHRMRVLILRFLCSQAIKKKKPNTVQCDADEIDIYIQEASPLVLPIRCKSRWNSPPKSYCAFLALCVVRSLVFAANSKKRPSVLPLLALCVVRTFLYAGRQVDEGRDEEASLARGASKSSPQCIVVQVSKCFKMP